jgi:NTE family protein
MAISRPDVLVLAAGGVVGEAWMTGVLAGIEAESDIDFRTVEGFVGTSAGAIVSASLAAGRSPRRPSDHRGPSPEEEAFGANGTQRGRTLVGGAARTAARWGGAVWAPAAPLALRAGAPGGALARRAVLSRVPAGRRPLTGLRDEVGRWGGRFDGRLRICTVDLGSGRRVVFGAPGEPKASVAEAVEASCAVPGIFRPVTIGGRVYVDGGAWSLTNLDIAPARRDTEVLCLTVTGGRGATSTPAALMRAAARPAIALEATALRRRGAHVRVIGPDANLGTNLLDPRGSVPALKAGFAQGRRLATASR